MAGSGLTLNSKPKGELKAYDPSLRDKLAWLLSDAFGGGDRSRVNWINEKARGAADFVPGVGDAIGVDDTKRAWDAGNYGEAALSGATTAIGAIPGGGDLLAAGLKGGAGLAGTLLGLGKGGVTLNSKPRLLEVLHGTTSASPFDLPDGYINDTGLHVTQDPRIASAYAGMDMDNFDPSEVVNGRIYPMLAKVNNMFDGVKTGALPNDYGPWLSPEPIGEQMRKNVNNPSSELQSLIKMLESGESISNSFLEHGYDAFKYGHPVDADPMGEISSAVALLEPSRQVSPRFDQGIMSSEVEKFNRIPFDIEDTDAEDFGLPFFLGKPESSAPAAGVQLDRLRVAQNISREPRMTDDKLQAELKWLFPDQWEKLYDQVRRK